VDVGRLWFALVIRGTHKQPALNGAADAVQRDNPSDVEAKIFYALAVNRNGMLTAADTARSLQLEPASVEALLNELSKTQPEYVSLEFDENGQPFYLFSRAGTRPHPFGAKYRVGAEGRVRVADVLGVDGPRQTLDDAAAQRRNGN